MIDFQFLRDCIQALKVVQGGSFSMQALFRSNYLRGEDPEKDCGTPACVIGHYVIYKGFAKPTDSFKEQNLAGHKHLGLNANFSEVTQSELERTEIHGLTYAQREELFGEEGCGAARTKEEAIAYIEGFILLNGGSLEDPKPLGVCATPDWQALAQVPVTEQE